jgi:hypothetical protein
VKDPAFRYQLIEFAKSHSILPESAEALSHIATVGDYYETMGLFVKRGLVDRDSVLDIWSAYALNEWERLAPVTAMFRRGAGDAVYENFEYLATLAQDWQAAHPGGTYPPSTRRMKLTDEWLEADAQYIAPPATS